MKLVSDQESVPGNETAETQQKLTWDIYPNEEENYNKTGMRIYRIFITIIIVIFICVIKYYWSKLGHSNRKYIRYNFDWI